MHPLAASHMRHAGHALPDHRISRSACPPRVGARQVLEDKANLVLLQRLMTAPTLESYAVNGRGAVAQWAQRRFQQQCQRPGGPSPPPSPPANGVSIDGEKSPEHGSVATMAAGPGTSALAATTSAGDGGAGGEDWWCVKAAGGNGGLDIWVMHAGNWKSVVGALSDNESYVIQVRRVRCGRRRFCGFDFNSENNRGRPLVSVEDERRRGLWSCSDVTCGCPSLFILVSTSAMFLYHGVSGS